MTILDGALIGMSILVVAATALYLKYGKPLTSEKDQLIDDLMNENAELHDALDGWCKEWCEPEKTGQHAVWCPKSKEPTKIRKKRKR